MRPLSVLAIQSEARSKEPPPLREESAWLAQAKQGDAAALRRLYEGYLPAVTRLCYRLLRQPTDIEDAVQSTFVQAFRALPQFREESSLKTWILRIAYNESMNLLRHPRHKETPLSENVTTREYANEGTERIAVQQALLRLSPEYRAILTLYYWEEMEYREIATVLQLSLPAVKMRMLRARHAFRRQYEE